jgi:hypothetical protein
MPRVIGPIFTFCILLTIFVYAARADGPPSKGAQGMPVALGTFEFKPDDWKEGELTWWKDTDGIKPGEAGCHVGTDADGEPNGRSFAEACLDGDANLVESNPDANELHSHVNDVGHPDKFDCNAWCIGQGATKGVCQAAPAPLCTQSSAEMRLSMIRRAGAPDRAARGVTKT